MTIRWSGSVRDKSWIPDRSIRPKTVIREPKTETAEAKAKAVKHSPEMMDLADIFFEPQIYTDGH